MIPLMKSTFLNEFETKQALADFILHAPKLSMGSKCSEFEREFANFQGSAHGVLFNSGSSANLAMLQSLKNLGKLRKGDKVGFSALTWSTNVMPIIQLDLEPVPIDCEPQTLNAMAHNLEDRLKKCDLKAFFITNALGFAGDLDRIRELCERYDILLIEDNCEALGTELDGGKAGTFGSMGSFSFFVAHHMSTIEGGMVCTDDSKLAEMLRIVRANGWDRNLNASQQRGWRERYNIKSEFYAKYAFFDLGYNLRPTEITGFLGLYQLQFLEENIRKRESNYIRLEAIYTENPDFIVLNRRHLLTLSNFAFPVLCKTPKLKDKYLSQFAGAGVEIRPMLAGNIQKQPFYAKYSGSAYSLPGTDMIHTCGFYCGNYPELLESDLEILGSCLREY